MRGDGGASGPRELDVETAVTEAIDTIGSLRPETFDPGHGDRLDWHRRLTASLDRDLDAAPSDVVEGAEAACKRLGRLRYPELEAAILAARDAREKLDAARRFDGPAEMFVAREVNHRRAQIFDRELWAFIDAGVKARGKPPRDPAEREAWFRDRIEKAQDEAVGFIERRFDEEGVGLGRVKLTEPLPPYLRTPSASSPGVSRERDR